MGNFRCDLATLFLLPLLSSEELGEDFFACRIGSERGNDDVAAVNIYEKEVEEAKGVRFY